MKNQKLIIVKFTFYFVFSLFIFSGCDKDDGPKGAYENGAFIVNEGTFGNNNGSVSFYGYNTDEVINNIFSTVNGRQLGDVVQSIKLFNDNAFIVVNNSNKVEIVNRYSFEEKGVIEDILSPRYMEAYDNKGYISCWGDNAVKVIDLNTNSVTKSIVVGSGPENMVVTNNKLFVANSGGWSVDSTISVIDLNTEQVIASIPVKYCPKDLEMDNAGKIWVLCYGKVVYDPVTYILTEETPSKIYRIDPVDNSVEAELTLFDTQHPSVLEMDNDGATMYFGGGFGFDGIYELVISGSQATSTKIIDDFAYGFSYDENSDILFVTIAPDFVDAGDLKRYTTDGALAGTYEVGIGPNGAVFKNAGRYKVY